MPFVAEHSFTHQHKIRLRRSTHIISYLLLLLFCLFHQIAAFSAPENNNRNRLTAIRSKNVQHQYIAPLKSFTAPLPSNHHHHLPDYDANAKSKLYTWLDQGTNDILDTERIPIGQLTTDDVESISSLMANWAKRKSEHSALQVEQLLKRVVDEHNAGNSAVNVSTQMYTMAIDAWARTGGKQAAERASEIHREMVEVYKQTGDVNVRPSTISYNAVINAWSKSGCDAEAAMKAEDILEEMLNEWKIMKKTNMIKKALDVDGSLNVLDRESSQKVDENDKDIEDEDGSIVKPDVVSFTSVIDTWAKSGVKNGAAKAMNLLKQMEQLYVEEGQLGMKPNGALFHFSCFAVYYIVTNGVLSKQQYFSKCYFEYPSHFNLQLLQILKFIHIRRVSMRLQKVQIQKHQNERKLY